MDVAMIGIERSRVDGRWCVFSRYRETLCPEWAIPIFFAVTVLMWPIDRHRAHRVLGHLCRNPAFSRHRWWNPKP
jgi:hypothetical protein